MCSAYLKYYTSNVVNLSLQHFRILCICFFDEPFNKFYLGVSVLCTLLTVPSIPPRGDATIPCPLVMCWVARRHTRSGVLLREVTGYLWMHRIAPPTEDLSSPQCWSVILMTTGRSTAVLAEFSDCPTASLAHSLQFTCSIPTPQWPWAHF